MNDNIKKQIVALLAAVQQGDQKATQALQEIMNKAKQGDQKAIALANVIQSVAKEMQQGTNPVIARLGAKLNYLRSLKGNCPEGMDIEYYKCGGQVKKKFIKKNACGSKGMAAIKAFKDKCGSKMKKKSCKEFGGEIQSDKCGSKMKKKSCKEFGGNIESNKCGSKMKAQNGMKTNSKTSNKWTQKDDNKLLKYRRMGTKTSAEKKDSIAIQRKWNRLPEKEKAKYEVQEQKCGGKAKKHLFGGVIGFQQGGSFKDAWNTARKNKVRYFNWNGRMYNSMDKGNDIAYQSFRDNMNELSAQLPTDRSPKHLGWEKNNPISNELRGNDRELQQHGTESQLQNITVIGTRRQPTKKPAIKKQSNFKVTYNVPMGAIEYTGRDGKQYWMRQDHSNGQYYYVDRNKPISYATAVVPEGYIIPGTNFKINKGTNIGKLALGLEKKWL